MKNWGWAVLLTALSLTAGAQTEQVAGCPQRTHLAQVEFTRVTNLATSGRATQVDVENARIGLIEARYGCGYIPRGQYCREKDWSLVTIARIARRAVELGAGPQANLDAARARLAAHRVECPPHGPYETP